MHAADILRGSLQVTMNMCSNIHKSGMFEHFMGTKSSKCQCRRGLRAQLLSVLKGSKQYLWLQAHRSRPIVLTNWAMLISHGVWQVVTATMPKLSADTLVANVNSGKLGTLGGKTIEAAELSSGAVFYGHTRRHYHGPSYDI